MDNRVSDEELVSFLSSLDCTYEDIELIFNNEKVKEYYINYYLNYKNDFEKYLETIRSHRK